MQSAHVKFSNLVKWPPVNWDCFVLDQEGLMDVYIASLHNHMCVKFSFTFSEFLIFHILSQTRALAVQSPVPLGIIILSFYRLKFLVQFCDQREQKLLLDETNCWYRTMTNNFLSSHSLTYRENEGKCFDVGSLIDFASVLNKGGP